jgi:CHRD domain
VKDRGWDEDQRRLLKTILIDVAILWIAFPALAQNVKTFKARLSPVPIDLMMMSRIAGSGSLSATLNGTELTIRGSFTGLVSPATDASIHRGPKGIRGPAILDLTVSRAVSGNVSGSVVLTPQQVEDLNSSRLYVQINSERAPDGNLWGWLLQ